MCRRMIVATGVILAIETSATRLTQREVQQVEQHTGMKAEDLLEEQLEPAMNDSVIEGQEPTDQEIAMLEVEEDKNPSV